MNHFVDFAEKSMSAAIKYSLLFLIALGIFRAIAAKNYMILVVVGFLIWLFIANRKQEKEDKKADEQNKHFIKSIKND